MIPEEHRLAILEGLLFVADAPVPAERLAEVLEAPDAERVRGWLQALEAEYRERGRALTVQEVAGGFRLATRPEFHPWVQRLAGARPARLSRAALETLAIIAYRQPITRAEIEAVRGVAVDGVLRTLLERDLVRILGRKPEPGRPLLYGTTTIFLEYLGLPDLSALPTLREMEEILGAGERPPAAEPVQEQALADAGAQSV